MKSNLKGDKQFASKAISYMMNNERTKIKEISYSINNSQVYRKNANTSVVCLHPYSTEIKFTNSGVLPQITKPNSGVLNIATYKFEGNDFLGGFISEESDLCFNSILYNVLSADKFKSEFYNMHCKVVDDNFGNEVIYSPKIEINGVECGVVTSALPYCSMFGGKDANLLFTLRERVDRILFTFALNCHKDIVLGIYDLSLDNIKPSMLAESFSVYLNDKYKNIFETVTFAIPESKTYKKFKEAFNT